MGVCEGLVRGCELKAFCDRLLLMTELDRIDCKAVDEIVVEQLSIPTSKGSESFS